MELDDPIKERLHAILPQLNGLGAIIGFDLGPDGLWVVDARSAPPVFVAPDCESDCLICCSSEVLTRLLEGKLDPMLAYTMGKIKISGSMGIALKLVSAIS
ncbi:MAG TPA: SCP2 sterol-binding domain-containing protein [Rhodospirillaceae bacterium]|nr:SCP2 sterol-binding domain-containing protein [Rhodospirillaceae bacterium]